MRVKNRRNSPSRSHIVFRGICTFSGMTTSTTCPVWDGHGLNRFKEPPQFSRLHLRPDLGLVPELFRDHKMLTPGFAARKSSRQHHSPTSSGYVLRKDKRYLSPAAVFAQKKTCLSKWPEYPGGISPLAKLWFRKSASESDRGAVRTSPAWHFFSSLVIREKAL